MEKQPHNNLWADKLLQVSMPDSGQAWVGMETLLERKMPQRGWSDWRRWLLLILLLLLLIGVCNCPGRGRFFHGAGAPTSQSTSNQVFLAARATHKSPAPHKPGSPDNFDDITGTNDASSKTITGRHKSPRKDTTATTTKKVTTTKTTKITGSVTKTDPATKTDSAAKGEPTAKKRAPDKAAKRNVHGTLTKNKTTARSDSPGTVTENGTAAKSSIPGTVTENEATARRNVSDTTARRKISDTAAKRSITDTASKKNVPTLQKPSPRKDSAHKKPPPPPKEPEQKEKDHGWVFGAGFNQFFPVGGQRGSTYNSNGLTGTLTDYLPVPMIRYYLNRKTYLQLEAQFNTPQPTAKNLVISSPVPDTSTQSGVYTQVASSASIQQLYYFNIPLSIHFNPWDNLNIGTGLQWSHLSNAIGEFDSSTSTSFNGNPTNTVDSKNTHSFKGDPLYKRIKTNELRFLVDANYTYKHFVLGLRYNQALSKFVNLQLPTGATTEARNSSLQLYLRYILWDTRKKKPTEKTP